MYLLLIGEKMYQLGLCRVTAETPSRQLSDRALYELAQTTGFMRLEFVYQSKIEQWDFLFGQDSRFVGKFLRETID